MEKSKISELLDELQDGKIDNAKDILQSISKVGKQELLALAALFDQKAPWSPANEFKLQLKRRKAGNPSKANPLSRINPYDYGCQVRAELVKMKAAKQGHNVGKAIDSVLKKWAPEGQEVKPSANSLRRYYYYALKVDAKYPGPLKGKLPPLK